LNSRTLVFEFDSFAAPDVEYMPTRLYGNPATGLGTSRKSALRNLHAVSKAENIVAALTILDSLTFIPVS
jgi:hypothetical protein